MDRTFKHLLPALGLATFLLAAQASLAEPAPSPYAGQQTRDIKALSAEESAALLSGKGVGFAKAAELNGYPGPVHVLELAQPLGLTDVQKDRTEQLLLIHRARAMELGKQLVNAERELDTLFASRQASDPALVDRATEKVGRLQAQLRAEHLKTHLTQTALLSREQVDRYAQLRGYVSNAQPADARSDGGVKAGGKADMAPTAGSTEFGHHHHSH